MKGRVVSTKMKNTATVLVERVAMHPLYKKTYIQSKKYLVEAGSGIKDGDIVELVKIKPVSKNKHWKIAQVVGRSLEEITEEVLKGQAEEAIAEVMPEEASESVDQSISVLEDQKVSKSEEKAEKKKEKKEDKEPRAQTGQSVRKSKSKK